MACRVGGEVHLRASDAGPVPSPLFLDHAGPEALEQRVVGVEDQCPLFLVRPSVRIMPCRTGRHLLQPRLRPDVRERRDDCNLWNVQALVRHCYRH